MNTRCAIYIHLFRGSCAQNVESRLRGAEAAAAGTALISTLTLVDLAGSESAAKMGGADIITRMKEGTPINKSMLVRPESAAASDATLRTKEGNSINKSLLALGNVIGKLAEGAQAAGVRGIRGRWACKEGGDANPSAGRGSAGWGGRNGSGERR